MSHSYRYSLVILLALSAVLLASLIPGGPIENRDFSHIDLRVLGGFNLFLTVLNLGTVALVFSVFRGRLWAVTASWFAALAYLIVYAIDLLQIFPESPTPMSQSLWLVEVLGIGAAIALMILSWRFTPLAPRSLRPEKSEPASRGMAGGQAGNTGARAMLLILIGALGIGIIVFATDSAMNPAATATSSLR